MQNLLLIIVFFLFIAKLGALNQVRSIGINVTGDIVQGRYITLECNVFGVRPAAKVRWTNGTNPIDLENFKKTDVLKSPISTKYIEEKDGTFTTISSLSFKPSRWENGQLFHCLAKNEVMNKNGEPELRATIILDVRYPPVVFVRPSHIVVNESTNTKISSAYFKCMYLANPQQIVNAGWLKDGKPLATNDTSKYVGGTTVNPALFIKHVTRADSGEYTCSLGNEIGTEISRESVNLKVLWR